MMKKKKVVLNWNFCRILSLVLAVFLCASTLLFSGCFEDEKEETGETFFERYVDGVSTVYADMAGQEISGLTEENTGYMLEKIWLGILGNYGNGQNSAYYYGNTPFPDSIRMLVTATDGNDKTSKPTSDTTKTWKWMINQNPDSVHGENWPKVEDLITLFSNKTYEEWKDLLIKNSVINYNFPTEMTNMLQVVLYEIMLGYEELSTLTVTTTNNVYQINIVLNNYNNEKKEFSTANPDELNEAIGNIKSGETAGSGYLGQLQNEYMSSTRYTGLTKQNADKLIDYILHEIIGADLVTYDHETFANQPVNYRNYVSTIAYLIYSQTFDGKDEDWVYTFTNGKTKISYTFGKADREKAVLANLLDGETQTGENNAKIVISIGEGGFTAKAATYVKYFEGEKFFGSAEEGVVDQYAEAGAPYAEYQSVVLVPRKGFDNLIDGGLRLESGFIYSVMSKNKDLRIRTTIRVKLQNENGDWFLYEFAGPEISFSSEPSFVNANGEACYEDVFDFGIDSSILDASLVKTHKDLTGYESQTFTVGFFDEGLVNDLKKNVGNDGNYLGKAENKKLQNLYKVVASKNGYGALTVLDEDKVDFSFFEICLDVVKSPNDPEGTDYKFSMVLSNSGLWPGIC